MDRSVGFFFKSLFGLILLSFECFKSFFSLKNGFKKMFGVGRKGQYNTFLLGPIDCS